jgi:hypothetical protein
MYQTFDLSGTHYDLGYQQGAQTEPFVIPAWWPAPPPLAFARACAAQVADIHPPLLDELQGYADGQRLPFEAVLRGVCRRSMRLRARPPYPEGGCSSFAHRRDDGQVRVGRNYVFYPMQTVRQRVRLRPERGLASVGMRGSVPGGRYDGVNTAGLFICLHVALSAEPEDIPPGIPFHLLPRLVLETCLTTRAAIDLLTRVQHLHPFNYLIADAQGHLAVVEAHPARVRVIEPTRAMIAATNHYRHPDMHPLQRGRKLDHSIERLSFLYAQAADEWANPVTDVLTHHASRLCGHAGGHTTLWSLSANLTTHTIAYAFGAPCETAYEQVEWPANH